MLVSDVVTELLAHVELPAQDLLVREADASNKRFEMRGLWHGMQLTRAGGLQARTAPPHRTSRDRTASTRRGLE